MRYLEFKAALKNKAVFNHSDIRKLVPGFDRKRLVEWQKAGYIIKIRNSYYCFADLMLSESFLHYLANQLYKPSYISLMSAMSFYTLIPEAVFGITSVGTLKTTSFVTPYGRFEYRSIKPSLFFGYQLVNMENLTIKVAEPEKMMLDYCYLIKPGNIAHFESLRINKDALAQIIDLIKFDAYLAVYQSPVMNQRASIFKSFLNA